MKRLPQLDGVPACMYPDSGLCRGGGAGGHTSYYCRLESPLLSFPFREHRPGKACGVCQLPV
jgi:hypothetical protein